MLCKDITKFCNNTHWKWRRKQSLGFTERRVASVNDKIRTITNQDCPDCLLIPRQTSCSVNILRSAANCNKNSVRIYLTRSVVNSNANTYTVCIQYAGKYEDEYCHSSVTKFAITERVFTAGLILTSKLLRHLCKLNLVGGGEFTTLQILYKLSALLSIFEKLKWYGTGRNGQLCWSTPLMLMMIMFIVLHVVTFLFILHDVFIISLKMWYKAILKLSCVFIFV